MESAQIIALGSNLAPAPGVHKFYIGLYWKNFRTMGTNFSPCKGSYVLNQFPSNVMFGMNGFHVSASGAIQGHHGPLVLKM